MMVCQKLSYGGNVQLINSVLIAICRSWTTFLLSARKIIREIERLLKFFSWGGSKKAKAKWSSICQPKESGGLGIIGPSKQCIPYKNHMELL